MQLLALETATLSGGVAIIGDGGLVAEYRLNIQVTHSERVLLMIDRVLKEAKVPLEEIDAVALSIGPGSFTGLRIGLATAKGLCLGTGKPMVPVSTLMALACRVPFSSLPVVPLLDAKKKEVYGGIFQFDKGSVQQLMKDSVCPVEEILRQLQGPALFLGDGAKVYADTIRDKLGGNAHFAPVSLSLPSAASVAEIAFEKLQKWEVSDPFSVVPVYLRRSEAEIRRGM